MFNYTIRRLLLMIPTMFGITLVVFFVMAMTPGGIGASLNNDERGLKPEEKKVLAAYYRARYGLDDHYYIQYLRWLDHVSPIGHKLPGSGFPSGFSFGLKWPDLGESFATHRPVSSLILEAVPITILMEFLSLPLVYAISIWTGIIAARARGKLVDVTLAFVLLGLYSIPTIWIGVMMIGFLTNRVKYVHWFPSNGLHDILADSATFLPSWTGWNFAHFQLGWMLDMGWHLCLPIVCMSYASIAFLSRLQRGALLETLGQDFIRTARAKGLHERIVIYRHAFRNSLIPLITVAASILPGLIGGSIVIETIFGIDGMGKLFIDAVNSRDRELMMALTLIAGMLQLIGNLISDLCYALADPRVSYGN